MARALQDGHFPVRWSQNFGYGYGMPLFEFYGPLPFYVGAIIYWLTTNAVFGIKLLYLISNVGTALGGYLLGKKLFGSNGGLITAAALTLAPYRAVNLFARGALNEVWAIMFLPWILLGALQLFHQEKRGWLTFCLGLTGLFLTHNITTMLFLPVLLLFVIGYFISLFWRQAPELYWKKRFRGLNFMRLVSSFASSGLLAVGLSAFYLLPAFLEKHFTRVEQFILTSYFDYRLHFLYIRQFFTPNWGYEGSVWGVADGISFFLGWGQWLAAIVLAGVVMWRSWRWLRHKKAIFPSRKAFSLIALFAILAFSSLYMSLLKAQWLWDLVPLLRFTQFPWRWLGIGIVFFSLLLGSVSWLIDQRWRRTYLAWLLVILMAVGSAGYFRPKEYLADANDYYYTDPQLIRSQLSGILPDYISTEMSAEPLVIPEELVINSAEVPAGQFEILADRTHEKLIKTTFTTDTLLSLAVAEYPGWRVTIDTQRWDRRHGPDGNLAVMVPAGEHLVAVRFLGTPLRQYADLTSLVAWVILAALLLPPAAALDTKKGRP